MSKTNDSIHMKTFNPFSFILLSALAIYFSACSNGKSTNATMWYAQKAYNVPEYIEPDWMEIDNIQCGQDQWMHVTDKMLQNPLIARLVDAYNANVVWHSVGSDMEVFWRWEVLTDSAMLCMDLTNISDEQTCQHAKLFIESTAAAQHDPTASAQQAMIQYLEWLTTYYNVSTFFNVDSVIDDNFWSVAEPSTWIDNYADISDKRGQSDTIFQQQLVAALDTTTDFNRFCALAIEYAHSSSEGPFIPEALPYLETALTAGIYSPMLRDAWMTWRAVQSSQMGMSKDSDIPNAEYNQLRMLCCYTMLCHIQQHPTDCFAINNFILTSYRDNIARYGTYPYGNQSVIEHINIFPEWADKIFSD